MEKDNPDPNHLDTLAEALYVNGQIAEAIKTEEKALSGASAENRPEFETRIQKYQAAMKNGTKPAAGQ